jgi:hypothetical protein
MGALRTGKDRRLRELGQEPASARPPVGVEATAYRPDDAVTGSNPARAGEPSRIEGMEQATHSARMLGGLPVPLTLLAQGARTTCIDSSLIYNAQTAISFPTPFGCKEARSRWTAQRAVRLGCKVLPREAACFPGQGALGKAITIGWNGSESRFLFRRGLDSGSKLSGAQWLRLQLMAQLQAKIPHPLRNDLPSFLPTSCLAASAVGVLFGILMGQGCFKRATMQVESDDIGGGESGLGKIRQEQLVDDASTGDTNPTLLLRCRMGNDDDTARLPL